jgi:hypothetical protein
MGWQTAVGSLGRPTHPHPTDVQHPDNPDRKFILKVMMLARWEQILRCLHRINNNEVVGDVTILNLKRLQKLSGGLIYSWRFPNRFITWRKR